MNRTRPPRTWPTERAEGYSAARAAGWAFLALVVVIFALLGWTLITVLLDLDRDALAALVALGMVIVICAGSLLLGTRHPVGEREEDE